MRSSRLLRILLLLMNRGRQTSVALAGELGVTPRTILRDAQTLADAGLPVVLHPGKGGGIELGASWAERLSGLSRAEAEALGVILASRPPHMAALGLEEPGRAATAALTEALPDRVRAHATRAAGQFVQHPGPGPAPDPRVAQLAGAVRTRHVATLRANSRAPMRIQPVALALTSQGWSVRCGMRDADLAMREWGEITISTRRFPAP